MFSLPATDFKAQYKKIDSNWAFDGSKPCYTEPTEYLGSEGSGELHPEFGCGEYLDRTAMKQAQAAVKEELPAVNKRHLPVQTLTLSNFAVDAGPFVSAHIHPHSHSHSHLTSALD
jgi:hypothetical protein